MRGYGAVLNDPGAGAHALETLVPGLSSALVAQQLHAELPAFLPADGNAGGVGTLDPATLRAWARWEVRFGIVARRPDVARMFDRRFLPAGGRNPS